MTENTPCEPLPLDHTIEIRRMIEQCIACIERDRDANFEPRAQALFKTTAEVLGDLAVAYREYESDSEQAYFL